MRINSNGRGAKLANQGINPTSQKRLSKLPEREDDNLHKVNRNKFAGFSKQAADTIYQSEKSET